MQPMHLVGELLCQPFLALQVGLHVTQLLLQHRNHLDIVGDTVSFSQEDRALSAASYYLQPQYRELK